MTNSNRFAVAIVQLATYRTLKAKPKQRRARNKVESGVWVDAQEEFLLLAGNHRKTSSGEEN